MDGDRIDVAIVRPPPASFARGITTSGLGAPDVPLAREQHARYVAALAGLGVQVIELPPDEEHPDSTFVEDTAVVLSPRCAVLSRPGALERRGETAAVEAVLRERFTEVETIAAPGTLDGGDVCIAGDTCFIGISSRTNPHGARLLAMHAGRAGYRAVMVPIEGAESCVGSRSMPPLHLKSVMAWIGGRRLVVIEPWLSRAEFEGFERVTVPSREAYAANCLRVNGSLIVAAGFPAFESTVRWYVERVITLDVSEFRKMDGGLSCLSLRIGAAERVPAPDEPT